MCDTKYRASGSRLPGICCGIPGLAITAQAVQAETPPHVFDFDWPPVSEHEQRDSTIAELLRMGLQALGHGDNSLAVRDRELARSTPVFKGSTPGQGMWRLSPGAMEYFRQRWPTERFEDSVPKIQKLQCLLPV